MFKLGAALSPCSPVCNRSPSGWALSASMGSGVYDCDTASRAESTWDVSEAPGSSVPGTASMIAGGPDGVSAGESAGGVESLGVMLGGINGIVGGVMLAEAADEPNDDG